MADILIFLKKIYAKLFSEEKRARFRAERKGNKYIKFFLVPVNFLSAKLWGFYCFFNAYKLSDYLYYDMFHKHINWREPKDFNEKIQWLKFYSDTSKWPILADKYKVRDWIKGRGLEHILNELYTIYKNENEIDLSRLPQSFVLKLNNGCHDRLLIKNKDQHNINDIRRHFRKRRKDVWHFAILAEHYYLKIKPCIIMAEKLLIDNRLDANLLMDYKFYCFHGEPKYVMLIHYVDQNNLNEHKIQTFDMDWNYLKGIERDEYRDNTEARYPKPNSFNEMKEICRVLASDFPFVRVDLYEIDGKPVFGEMTFTPSSGRDDDYVQDFLDQMGKDIDLAKVKKLKKRNFS